MHYNISSHGECEVLSSPSKKLVVCSDGRRCTPPIFLTETYFPATTPGVVRPVRKLCRMFAVICWAAGLTRFGEFGDELYPSSPHAHWIVPALNTRAPLCAV